MTRTLLLIAALFAFTAAAQAQYNSNQVRRVGSLPASCTPGTTNPVLYSAVVYTCTATNTWTATSPGQLPTSTYAGLPTCAAANDGQLYRVTDKNRDIYKCNGTAGTWVSTNGSVFNVQEYGAVGDGSTHPLSGTYASIAAAAAVYPRVGTLWGLKITDGGSGFTSTSGTLTIGGGGGTGATAKWYAAVGQVTKLTLTGAGSGYRMEPRRVTMSGGTGCSYIYGEPIIDFQRGGANNDTLTGAVVRWSGPAGCTSAPTVTIDAPDTVQATATYTSTAGALDAAITVSYSGLGYTTGTTATIPACTGAVLTVTTYGGVITGITRSGGTSCPASGSVTISAPNGTTATATASISGITDTYIINPGSGYDPNASSITATVVGGGGSGATITASALDLTAEKDQVAAQTALDNINSTYGGVLYFPSGKYLFRHPVKLPAQNANAVTSYRLQITGAEATLAIADSVATTIFERKYNGLQTDSAADGGVGGSIPDQRINHATNWSITNLRFIAAQSGGGGRGSGSHALDIDSTYNLKLDNLSFTSFDTAIECRFCLRGMITNSRFTNNYTENIYLDYLRLAGFNYASNAWTEFGDRHYAIPGQVDVRVLASSEFSSLDSVHEGDAPKYSIEAHPIGHSTSVGLTVRGTHFEHSPSYEVPYTAVKTAMAGTSVIDKVFPQWGNTNTNLTLVDGYEVPGGATVIVSNLDNMPGRLNFRGVTGAQWNFINAGTVNWASPPTPSGSTYHSWNTDGGASLPTSVHSDCLLCISNRWMSTLSIGQLALGPTGTNVQAAEVFRSESQGKTGHIFNLFTDSASAYNLSFANRTFSTSQVAGIYVSNAGTFVLEGIGANLLQLWANSAMRLSVGSSGVTVGNLILTNVAATNQTGSVSLDLSSGNIRTVTFGAGNISSFTATNVPVGLVTIALIQDSVGGRTVTWNSLFKFAGATAPTLSAAASARDQFNFQCDGTNCYLLSAVYDLR